MSTTKQERNRIYALRARLKRTAEALKAAEVRLLVLHADRSGMGRFEFPGVPLLTYELSPLTRSLQQFEERAANGCIVCADWLKTVAERRARVEQLRNTRLPERAPDYDGPSLMPPWATKVARKLSPEFLRSSESAEELATRYIEGRDQRDAASKAAVEAYVQRNLARDAERRARSTGSPRYG